MFLRLRRRDIGKPKMKTIGHVSRPLWKEN
jgi:hypothetical protein